MSRPYNFQAFILLRTYLVAIPEHLDSIFSATRSPRSSFRAGPVTVATLITGENSVPSVICHLTLDIRAVD